MTKDQKDAYPCFHTSFQDWLFLSFIRPQPQHGPIGTIHGLRHRRNVIYQKQKEKKEGRAATKEGKLATERIYSLHKTTAHQHRVQERLCTIHKE
jgi:hypothetical protein